MKMNATFLRLLAGALVLTNLRSLEGETERTFAAEAAECESIDALISLIGRQPDQRTDAAQPLRLGSCQLLLQGGQVSVNLVSSGLGCQVKIRLRTPGQLAAADAECTLDFDHDCKLNGHSTPKNLSSFVEAARKKNRVFDAEAILHWIKEFETHEVQERQSIGLPALAGVTA